MGSADFVFYEFHLTRRAKQWHYVIVAHSKAAPVGHRIRRAKAQLSRNPMNERSSFHAEPDTPLKDQQPSSTLDSS
jgi:hypothetical protein